MATYTPNYNLEKPAQSDLYNVDVFNDNADKIDTALWGKSDASNLAVVEPTNTASQPYSVGQYLVLGGILHKVTAAIASGGTIIPGTNVDQDTVGTELKSLKDALSPFYPTAWIANVDLNTLTDTGIYAMSSGLTNAPNNSSSMWSPLVVIKAMDTTRQIALLSSGAVWVRALQSGTWTTWKALAFA